MSSPGWLRETRDQLWLLILANQVKKRPRDLCSTANTEQEQNRVISSLDNYSSNTA